MTKKELGAAYLKLGEVPRVERLLLEVLNRRIELFGY
jgi:hypothetical protein